MKNVIELVHKKSNDFELISNEIYNLGKRITKNISNIKYKKTQVIDEGFLEKNSSTLDVLDNLIKLYEDLTKTKTYEQLILITNFYVDFINLEIFDKHNREIGLLVLYSLIFKEFPNFKYVSFFKYFNENLELFNYSLDLASYNWHSKFPQTDNLNEVIYKIISSSLKEVDDFSYEFEFQTRLNKTDSIENTILKFNKDFSKDDIRKIHPTISNSTINRTLFKLRDEGKIRAIGTGRSAKWQIIIDNKDFLPLTIFDNFN